MNDGAIPKLIKSAKESSSNPKLELLFNRRAIFPSKLSKKEANTTKNTANSHFDSVANLIDVKPKVKEKKVTMFGIKTLIDNFFILKFF